MDGLRPRCTCRRCLVAFPVGWPVNPPCRARHNVFPESTVPCLCTYRPQDYMQRPEPEALPVVPLAECYERGIIPRPKNERGEDHA